MTSESGQRTRQSVGSKIGPPEGLNSAKCFSEGGPVTRRSTEPQGSPCDDHGRDSNDPTCVTRPRTPKPANEREVEREALRRYGEPQTDIEAIEFNAVKEQIRAEWLGERGDSDQGGAQSSHQPEVPEHPLSTAAYRDEERRPEVTS